MLEYMMDEQIIPICKALNARAYISLNAKHHDKVARATMVRLALLLEQGDNLFVARHAYESAAVTSKTIGTKWWVLDADIDDSVAQEEFPKIVELLQSERKEYHQIPTVSGYHLLTTPFNREGFMLKDDHLHKEALTLLYYDKREKK